MISAEAYFEDLLGKVIEGVANEEEFATFMEIVRRDADLRVRYVKDMRIHAILSFHEEKGGERSCVEGHSQQDGKRKLGKREGGWRVAAGRCWKVAAAVAVLLGGAAVWYELPLPRESTAVLPVAPVLLIGQSGVSGLDLPESLPGLLRLSSGEAVVKLQSGVELTVIGPVEVAVRDCMQVRLESGRLLANVPHWATGFTVRTAELEVYDLGTIFSVSVTSGVSEVFVFKGSVQVNEAGYGEEGRTASGSGVGVCEAGEGVRAVSGESPAKIAADWPEAQKLFGTLRAGRALEIPEKALETATRIADLWADRYMPRLASGGLTPRGRLFAGKGFFGRGDVAGAQDKTKEENTMNIKTSMTGLAAAALLGAARGSVIDFRGAVRGEPDLIHHYTFEGPRVGDNAPRMLDRAGDADLKTTNCAAYYASYTDGCDAAFSMAGRAGTIPGGSVGEGWRTVSPVSLPTSLTVECVVSFYTNAATADVYALAHLPAIANRAYFLKMSPSGALYTTIGNNANDRKTIVPSLVIGHWYYIASTYTVGGGNTTINSYCADLTAGGELRQALTNAVAAGVLSGSAAVLTLGGLHNTANGSYYYVAPCVLDEVALYSTAHTPESIQKRFAALGAAAPLAEYREIFPNDNGPSRYFPQEGWQVYRTGAAASYGWGVTIASSQYPTAFGEAWDAAASFPSTTGALHGYASVYGAAGDTNVPYFAWTDEMADPLDAGWLKMVKFDGYMSSNYTGRVALRVDTNSTPEVTADDVWFASADFGNPAGTGNFQFPNDVYTGTWRRYWLDVPGAEWTALDFEPGVSMGPAGTQAAFPTNGLVTAFGVYTDGLLGGIGRNARYDTFTIYATRVYPPPPPGGTLMSMH